MDAEALKQELLRAARTLGFAAAGVTTLEPFTEAGRRALQAIDEGRMDGMAWFTRERVQSSADLGARYPWGRSLLALAFPYRPALAPGSAAFAPAGTRGRMAAYACLDAGEGAVDYHDLLAQRCDQLLAWLRGRVPEVRGKRFVDHGWAMDRAIAERAGIGFSGKHTQVLTLEAGSYVLLASLVLSVALPSDQPSRRDCGGCAACLPACPTGALIAPGVIDARRCISYLTIEHRGPIDPALRPLVGTWAFGCDLCQEACPINARLAPQALPETPASTVRGPVPFPDLVECLQLDDAAFAARFRGTAVWRTGRAGLARNCAIALGNAGDPGAVPALRHAADLDPDLSVRDAAAWALERLATLAGA